MINNYSVNLNTINERRKSSAYSSKLYLQNNIIPPINSSNNIIKLSSESLNKKEIKDNFFVNKSPLRAKMKSFNQNPKKLAPLKMNSLQKNSSKKNLLNKTGIFTNIEKSIRNMEINLRRKLIDMTIKIENEELLKNIDSFASIQALSNKKLNKMSNSLKLENHHNKSNSNRSFKINLSSRNINMNNIKLKLEQNNTSPKNFSLKKSNKNISIDTKKKINEINYRKLIKMKILYDSFEDNESEKENENIGFFISPNNTFILIFDFLIIVSTLIIAFYNPYYISTMKCFCFSMNSFIKYLYFFIDLLFICDILLGFWRAYYNRKFQLENNISNIIKHYFSTNFLMDFLQSFPLFTLIRFQCQKDENKYCKSYAMNNSQILLILFTVFKQLKFYKMTNKKTNSIILKLYDILNDYSLSEKIIDIPIIFFSVFFGFFTFISIHIFIANQNYPNWITLADLQDRSIFIIYLNSLYFIITTITTVGYGDMLGPSLIETIFRVILLTLGISLYSWIVSIIGNYVNNENRISIKFNKDEATLEEIRISYPNMPYKLYNQILHHLELRKLRQKKLDLNLLINSLPYYLRNIILFSIHQKVIKNFKIFKKCQNSDFINQVLTFFIPLFSKKNAILIYENQLIDNIIFVKDGRLTVEAAIDILTPNKSINEYFNSKFIDINDKTSESKMDSINRLTSKSVIPNDLDLSPNTNEKNNSYSEMEDSMEKEIGRVEFEGGEFEESNYQFINIVSITKNESYGTVYMFLSKPSPLSLRVKSKKAELFLLRKYDAIAISKRFPNIWKKHYNKSYINMNSIKNKTFKKLTSYCQTYGIILEKQDPNLLKKHNYTIKEILEKAKQKDRIINSNLDNSISNIFKNSNCRSPSCFSPKNNLHLNNNRLQVNLPAQVQVKTFVNEEKTGDVGFSSQISLNKNNFMSFAAENSRRSNNSSSKIPTIFSSKGIKPEQSKFKINSSQQVYSSNEQSSFRNIIRSETLKNEEKNNEIIKNKSSPLYDKNYIKKLKKKIKKLKVSKLYYKSLLKKISDKLKEFKKQNNKNFPTEIITSLVNYKYEKDKNSDIEKDDNDNKKIDNINNSSSNNNKNNPKVINNVIVQNNNNYICSFSDFISSDTNKSSSSTDRKTDFLIDKTSEFNFKGEYTNLKQLTKGEIVNNSKFKKKSLEYIQNLYKKIKNKRNKNRTNNQTINENMNKALTIKAQKELLEFYKDNIGSQSFVFSDNEQEIKEKEIKKQLNDSLSSKNQFKIKNNKNLLNNNDKNNSKITLLNMNNIYNYSFKMNVDDTLRPNININNESNNHEIKQNENHMKDNLNSSFYKKKISLKKSDATEDQWESKNNKNINILNNLHSNNKEIDFICNYNSSIEQGLKSDRLSKQRKEFINIKNEILKRKNEKKERNKKIENDNRNEKRNEFCFII